MTNELTIIVPEEMQEIATRSGLEKALTHARTYAPFMNKVIEIASKLQGLNPDNPLDLKIARDCRLALVTNRTDTDKQKDTDKVTLLAEVNLIQSLRNVVINNSVLIEADFKAIEKVAENIEVARKVALKADRETQLAQFELDLTGYNLAEMSEQTFVDLLTSQRLLRDERIATAAAMEAEAIRYAAELAKERERVRLENLRLQFDINAAKIEAAKLAKGNADKLAKIEAANKAARDKAAKEQAVKDKATADEFAKYTANMNRIAKELQDKKDADTKLAEAIADNIIALQSAAIKAAKAPVKEKLRVWVTGTNIDPAPDMIPAADEITAKFNGWKQWALNQIEQL